MILAIISTAVTIQQSTNLSIDGKLEHKIDNSENQKPIEDTQNQDKTGTKANKQKPTPYEKKRTPDIGVRPGAQEESRDYRLFRIRQQMLEALEWTSFPVIQDRRRLLSRTNLTQFSMHTDLCYVAVCPTPNWRVPDSRQIMKIKFDVFQSNDTVHNATLNLFLKQRTLCQCSTDIDQNRLNVKIYQLIPRPNRRRGRGRGRRRRLIHTQMIRWDPSTWVSFDITRAAQDWVRDSSRNLGLVIQVYDEFDIQINANSVFVAVECSRSPDIDCSEINMIPQPRRPFDIVESPTMKVTQISIPGRQRRKRDTGRYRSQTESRKTGQKMNFGNSLGRYSSTLSYRNRNLLSRLFRSKVQTNQLSRL
ncbi:hypothetical protein FSP39_005584 [Pinctada imbricata]|uniref:TGF-beta propeptide domain-containing protein n=1 Tax=Pinctada imbricata TaxID=66713 RepID=A0AA88YTH4_PINIB|nr:hypothetical protein FSP39_005584 [Pinctada imbricata]